MKFFAFIMALVVFVQSAVPCMDRDMLMNSTNNSSTIFKAVNDSHQDCSDNCSPFCTCSCCASANCTLFQEPLAVLEFSVTSIISEYISCSPIEIALPVWQPPQLIS